MSRQIVVTGAEGMLGRQVVRVARGRDFDVVGLSRRDMDITNVTNVRDVLSRRVDPIIINCAGIVKGRREISDAQMGNVNSRGPHLLARHTDRLVQISTDCVFDGKTAEEGYTEASKPCPGEFYGKTKLAGEIIDYPHLTIRGSFVGFGNRSLLHWLMTQPGAAQISGFADWKWNGSYVYHFASRVLDLALNFDLAGLVHLPGPVVISKHDLLVMLVHVVRPDITVTAKRMPPRYMVLASNRIDPMTSSWSLMLECLDEDHRRYTRRSGTDL